MSETTAPKCPHCGNGMFHNGLPGDPHRCYACGTYKRITPRGPRRGDRHG